MRFWKRSIRQDDRSHRDFTRARGPSRKRRLQLENLEERALLSTYTLSEFYVIGIPTVSETVNNTTTDYFNPPSPFVVNTGSGSNTVNILNTSADIAINEIGSGTDTVNVGNGGSVQGILAAVNIQNPPSYNTINVNDSADPTARTVTLSTYSSGGYNWGSITGLAPAAINYKYFDTSSVNITTGSAADTVNVLATGVTTNISDGGYDVVNVGDGGSVQGILGTLNLQDPPSYNTINVNDSADTTARTVTLGTYSSGGYNWGSITGLAPAAINYKYFDTSSVNITTGSAADTVNVLATGVTTNISDGGYDVVNVGDGGSVQGILGTLNLQDPPSYNTINVNDSADTTARTVTLSTYSSGGYNWGSITGLAPAAINYKYFDTSSVNITTGSAADTVNVLATGVTTYLNSSGSQETVNVGSDGSVQGILGDLFVENPQIYIPCCGPTPIGTVSSTWTNLNIDDSADTAAHYATLSSGNGLVWGEITGLAPAAISFVWADVSSVNISTSPGRVTWDVYDNALEEQVGWVPVIDNGDIINLSIIP